MKHVTISSLLFVLLFLPVVFADKKDSESLREDQENQARELAQEVLTGRNVCVRVYNDWKKNPRVYKLFTVKLNGLSFQCDSVTEAFGPMSESALIVVAGQDQTDEAVALVVDNFVYVEYYSYKKGGNFHIWPEHYRENIYSSWIFTDTDGAHIPNANVEIFIGSDRYPDNKPCILLNNVTLDNKGQLESLVLVSDLRDFCFLVNHPVCGFVRIRDSQDAYTRKSNETYTAPSSQKDKWYVFTDALGEPIPNATVEICTGRGWEVGQSEPFAKFQLDEKGQLTLPQSDVRLEMCHFVLSHPDYGIALIEPTRRGVRSVGFMKTCTAPLVRVGVKADERTIWGAVVDPNDTPVANALIECRMVISQVGGFIHTSYYDRSRVITDKQGRFAMYLPIDTDSDKHGSLVPLASKYCVIIEPPKALGLRSYMGDVNSGEESIITMYPPGYGGYFHTFSFEDEFGPITDPVLLREIEIIIRYGKSMRSFGYNRWKNGGKFLTGTYRARIRAEESLIFGPIEVTEDSPELLVFKATDRVVYTGRVIHGLTGEPISGAIVMKRPSPSDIVNSDLEVEQMEAFQAIGPELVLDDSIFELLKEDFKSTMMVLTDSDGVFQIALPKEEGRHSGEIIAAQKDYLGRRQQLKYIVPINKGSSGRVVFKEFEPDQDGYVKLPPMKLFPAGTIIVEPNIPGYDPREKYEIRFHSQISPEDTTPWLKDFGITPGKSRGGSVFYKNKLLPNHIQSVYIAAGVEQTIKIFRRRETQWAPVVIPGVKLRQGEILDLGRIDFKPNFKVAVKVIDLSSKPVEGVVVSGLDENGLYMGQKPVTNINGIVMLYVPPHSKGRFVVTYYDESTKKNIQEDISYETAGQEDAGRQFTLQISDEMLYNFFK